MKTMFDRQKKDCIFEIGIKNTSIKKNYLEVNDHYLLGCRHSTNCKLLVVKLTL